MKGYRARLAALLLLLPALAAAGANETPGENGQPHRFGYFAANYWEFGASDKSVFDKYVVQLQHYAQGSRFVDSRLDTSTGGAGVWNFVEFCANRRHDVLLLTAHGLDGPATTVIASFPLTPAGLAARDSIFAHWNGIMPGRLVKEDYPDDGDCTIEANQLFYTRLFQTPQALAWWATCYSAELKLTGQAEARVHVGYDDEVLSNKCLCDERYILRRMNGHEGQDKRPIRVAALGVNGACPPGGAETVIAGKQNTVLSPAVIDYLPRGIVCQPTVGYVEFDTSMDITVPADEAIKAEGDGVLLNEEWAGDDRVSFLVLPIGEQPTILYRVPERSARSKADHARLDGNTNPQINAYGPNRDDFIWVTKCPAIPAPKPRPQYPVPTRSTPSTPGGPRTIVTTPIYNGSGATRTVNAVMTDANGWLVTAAQQFEMADGDVITPNWEFQVPVNAMAGAVDSLRLTVESDLGTAEALGALVVDQALSGSLAGAAVVAPVPEAQTLTVLLENEGVDSLALRGAVVTDALGWGLALAAADYDFAPGASQEAELTLTLPGAPPGVENPLMLHGEVNGEPVSVALGVCRVGAPLAFAATQPLAVVPGNPDAQLAGGIENSSQSLPLALDYQVTDADGRFAWAAGPSALAPGDSAGLTLHVDLPADPALIGQAGTLTLRVSDLGTGLEVETPFPYVIAPAIAVRGQSGPPAPVYTGVAEGRSFPWPLTLENESALPISGTVSLMGGPPISPPSEVFMLLPGDSVVTNFSVRIDEAHPAGIVLPVMLSVLTDGGIGDRLEELALYVQPPVVAHMRRRTAHADEGDTGVLSAVLENLRPDRAMPVAWDWGDERGWLLPPLAGSLELTASATETLRVEFAIPAPAGARAAADSDSVALRLHLLSDGGLPIETGGSIWLMVLGEATGAPDQPLPARDALLANFRTPSTRPRSCAFT